MIRPCTESDVAAIHDIINEAAEAYRGVIPADRWHDPYMSEDQLRAEIAAGVKFWSYEAAGQLVGVMGLQTMPALALIRHAYVRPAAQGKGIGGALIAQIRGETDKPLLIGTWAAATWAVAFYERYGFRLVSAPEKDRLLRAYWTIPDRQIETSVVLADRTRAAGP
jgi:N-acetylglutamate synthase-like GNAT family acetyltransferase